MMNKPCECRINNFFNVFSMVWLSRIDSIWVTWRVSYKKQELRTLREFNSPFLVGSVLMSEHLIDFIRVVGKIIWAYCLGTDVCTSGDSAHTYFTYQLQNHWKSSDGDYCYVRINSNYILEDIKCFQIWACFEGIIDMWNTYARNHRMCKHRCQDSKLKWSCQRP
jgi:hypothetical protein